MTWHLNAGGAAHLGDVADQASVNGSLLISDLEYGIGESKGSCAASERSRSSSQRSGAGSVNIEPVHGGC